MAETMFKHKCRLKATAAAGCKTLSAEQQAAGAATTYRPLVPSVTDSSGDSACVRRSRQAAEALYLLGHHWSAAAQLAAVLILLAGRSEPAWCHTPACQRHYKIYENVLYYFHYFHDVAVKAR